MISEGLPCSCLDPQSTRERHNAMVTCVDACMRKDQVGTLLAECSGFGVRASTEPSCHLLLLKSFFSADHPNRMTEWPIFALNGTGPAD